MKKIFLIFFVFLLLVCSVYAAKEVTDFEIDDSYNNTYNGTYYSLYLNDKQDSGVAIFKNVDDDAYDDTVNDDAYDNLIHDDGREYITADDDLKIDKNSNNIANFTDFDHAEKGVVEIIKCDGQEFIVVFWAKNSSNVTVDDLTSQLDQFNKDNKVEAISF